MQPHTAFLRVWLPLAVGPCPSGQLQPSIYVSGPVPYGTYNHHRRIAQVLVHPDEHVSNFLVDLIATSLAHPRRDVVVFFVPPRRTPGAAPKSRTDGNASSPWVMVDGRRCGVRVEKTVYTACVSRHRVERNRVDILPPSDPRNPKIVSGSYVRNGGSA